MQKYYEELIKKLNKLFNDKKYDQIIDICKEELELAYIPKEIEFELNKFKMLAETTINVENIPVERKQLTLQKIKEKLNNDNLNDLDVLYLIDQLKDFNLNLVINEIENIFLNNDLQWYIKFLMIKYLVKQKIDHNFKLNYLNKYTNCKSFVIFNPINFDYSNYENIQIQCFCFLQNKIKIKDPSLYEIAKVLCMDLVSQLCLFDQDILMYVDAICYFVLIDAIKCLNIVNQTVDDYIDKPKSEKIEYISNLTKNMGRTQ